MFVYNRKPCLLDGPRSYSATVIATTVYTTKSTCLSSEFECRVKVSCIPTNWKCDGTTDCEDGTDEDDCGMTTTIIVIQEPHYCQTPCYF